MSEAENPAGNGFFQAGGTLKSDVPSYVERPADRELYESILRREYCYILTPRQMGKSSVTTRTAARLRGEGYHVAVVDLTGIGGHAKSMTAEQWYYGLAHRLLRELRIDFPLADWWQEQSRLPPLQRLMNFFEEGILSRVDGRVFIFVDEIDTTIKLDFSDDFFAAIRGCFNARANDSRLDRLNFVLLGVASPADLIRDPTRTPFNIGKRIELTDFSDREAQVFLKGLADRGQQAQALLTRILYWTGGHPYLTQRLCMLVRGDAGRDDSPAAQVDRLVAAEFFGIARRTKEDHLKVVHERIAQAEERAAILKTYAKVLKGKTVQDQPQSPIHSALKLAGLVKTDEKGQLRVRNPIYRKVFDARWIRSLQPPKWKQHSAFAIVVLSAISFGWWIGTQQLTLRSGISIVLAWLEITYPEPEMVEIREGRFTMGSPELEEGRLPDEGPQHEVKVRRFALSKYEVTFDQYDVFAFLVNGDGGCIDGHEITRISDEGWGRGRRPVINVSWQDATCYAEWLSRKTGTPYRLPTEAEWEYAARAVTTTPHPWSGELEAACRYANVLDGNSQNERKKRFSYINGNIFPCGDGFPFTAPVGSFLANAFGLHDMLGNVWEWTQDCWINDYVSASDNGTSTTEIAEGTCDRRAARGGSWSDLPENLRSAVRYWEHPDEHNIHIGFRIARDQ